MLLQIQIFTNMIQEMKSKWRFISFYKYSNHTYL